MTSAADQEDAAQERKCTEEAKLLLEQCVARSRVLSARYRLTLLLGYGTFGIVVEAVRGVDNRKVAIKIMRKCQIHPSRMCTDPRTGASTPLEIALLKYCPRHQNIIAYHDSWEEEECWYLVTDLGGHPWAQGHVDPMTSLPLQIPNYLGEEMSMKQPPSASSSSSLLFSSLHASNANSVNSSSSKKALFENITLHSADPHAPPQVVVVPQHSNNHSLAGFLRACGAYNTTTVTAGGQKRPRWGPVVHEDVQRHIFQQMVETVHTLHSHGIVHKDLKDENVLLDADLNCRLIDFGHSAFYRTPTTNPHISPFKSYGTPLFAPPEVRSGMTYRGPEGDVYALGLMLFEMNYGDLPDNVEDAVYLPDGESPFDISARTGFWSAHVRDLCAWMLCPDPALRATMDDIRQHPWLN